MNTTRWMMLVGLLTCPTSAWADDQAGGSDHVVVVLDGSGSMRAKFGDGTRMQAAKEALRVVLAELPAETEVGLLAFSSSLRQPWLYEIGPRDDEALAVAIDQPQPGGRTPLGLAIKTAADELLEVRAEEHGYGTYRLLVITDGEATDAELVERYAPELVARGLGLDVIGVAMAQEHTLKQYGHSYRSADDPSTLVATVREALAEVSLGGDEGQVTATFAELEGLPDDFAFAALEALALTGSMNHALGTPAPTPRPTPTPLPPPPPPAQDPEPASGEVPSGGGGCDAAGLAPGAGWIAVLGLALLRRED